MIKKNDKSKLSSVVAGVAGAVAVAGVAVAATIALKDKKTREKVKNTLTNFKNRAMDYVETIEIDNKNKLPKVNKITKKKKRMVK